jgi:hypothetical protein
MLVSRAEQDRSEDRSTPTVMGPGRSLAHRGVGLDKMAGALRRSIGPKAGAVLAGVGLYVLIADALSVSGALFGPLHFIPPDVSLIDVVMYFAVPLLTAVVEFFIAPMFAGWASGQRGWLYGLVTGLCLSFPQSALALRSLTGVPLDSFGDFGGLLADMPWPAPLLAPLGPYIPALCLLPQLAMPLVGAFGGFCGERMRVRGAKDREA